MITRPWGDKSRQLVDPWTLFGKDSRIVPLFNPIISSSEVVSVGGGVPSVSENIFGSLMLLSQESDEPIKMLINCPGGSAQAGFTIIQAMEHLKAKGVEIWTIDMCQAASMAGIILFMGTPGRRYILNDAMAHAHEIQIKGLGGGSTDVEEIQEHTKHLKGIMERLCAQNTKIPEYYVKLMEIEVSPKQMSDLNYRKKLVREFVKQERILTCDKALEAGMVDHIIMPGDPILDEIFKRTPLVKEEKK